MTRAVSACVQCFAELGSGGWKAAPSNSQTHRPQTSGPNGSVQMLQGARVQCSEGTQSVQVCDPSMSWLHWLYHSFVHLLQSLPQYTTQQLHAQDHKVTVRRRGGRPSVHRVSATSSVCG